MTKPSPLLPRFLNSYSYATKPSHLVFAEIVRHGAESMRDFREPVLSVCQICLDLRQTGNLAEERAAILTSASGQSTPRVVVVAWWMEPIAELINMKISSIKRKQNQLRIKSYQISFFLE